MKRLKQTKSPKADMKKPPTLLIAILVAVLPLRAQPLGGSEPINGFAGPNGPLEMWFPNVFDPFHPKEVTFQGHAAWSGPVGVAPAPLFVTFDYVDLTGQIVFLPGWVFPGDLTIPIDVQDLLPFCPQRVSIHFDTKDPFGYEISGTFTHQCIPEPAQVGLLAGLGLLGTGVYRRLRRREPTA
jgi:hypothetical protein